MHPARQKVTDVDQYLTLFPEATKEKLEQLRELIRDCAPEAEEVISYNIPAYKYHGFLVYFSGYAKHVSISFPPRTIMQTFHDELSPYVSSKSTVQFPLDKPLPLDLIRRMVIYKMKENREAKP